MTDLRKILDEATPGPWIIEKCSCGSSFCDCYGTSNGSFEQGSGYHWPDARLIALAPQLAAEVLRTRKLLDDVSDPDFLFGAMDNVNDMGVSLTDFANAASRAIRAAMEEK